MSDTNKNSQLPLFLSRSGSARGSDRKMAKKDYQVLLNHITIVSLTLTLISILIIDVYKFGIPVYYFSVGRVAVTVSSVDFTQHCEFRFTTFQLILIVDLPPSLRNKLSWYRRKINMKFDQSKNLSIKSLIQHRLIISSYNLFKSFFFDFTGQDFFII